MVYIEIPITYYSNAQYDSIHDQHYYLYAEHSQNYIIIFL